MAFSGRVYFSFGSRDTFHFYRFLAAAVDEGAELQLSWVPFLEGDDPAELRAAAAFAAVKGADPDRHGAYLQAFLGSVHIDGAALDDDAGYVAAAEHAGVEPAIPLGWIESVEAVRAASDEGRELGVTATPAIFRYGPVLRVVVNPAALQGDVLARLDLIDRMIGDDGVWRLDKP